MTLNNHAVTRYYPSSLAQVRKKYKEQLQRFLSSLRSSQHCLLPGTLFCFTFVKQRQTRTVCRNFSWLGLRHLGSSGHPSCARRRTSARCVYALRGLDVIYQVTVCALRGSDVIYQRHASLRPTRFRRHLSARPPAYAIRSRRHLSGRFRYTSHVSGTLELSYRRQLGVR